MAVGNQPPNYPSIIERNFVSYTVDDNPAVRYLRHPSGIIVVTLSANSELVDKPLTSIEWEVSGKKGHGVDRSKLAVSGKSKRGALRVFPDTRLCRITAADGTVCVLRAGVDAILVEVNDEWLTERPNLARTARDGEGFLAIFMPVGHGAQSVLNLPKQLRNETR